MTGSPSLGSLDSRAASRNAGGGAARAVPAPWTPGEILTLAAILLVAAGLRLRLALGYPLGFDEIYVVHVARQSLGEAFRLVAADIHPPLQYLLHWAWVRIGGDGALWFRSLSIAFALGSMGAAYALGRRVFGPPAALFALALLALNPEHLVFSVVADDYSLEWLLLMVATASGWAWLRDGRVRDAVIYVIAGALATYSHYLSIYYLLVLCVTGVALMERKARLRWLALHVVIAAAFLPQVPVFVTQFHREGSGAYFRFPTPDQIGRLWRQMSFNVRAFVPLMAILALIPLARSDTRRPAIFLWVMCAIPLLATRGWVVILPREALHALPLYLLLVAGGLAMIPWRIVSVLGGLALLAGAGRAALRASPHPEPVAFGKAEAFLRTRVEPGALVVHGESHSMVFFTHYLPRARNRILVEAGQRVPFYDAGLVIPESLYISPEQLNDERARGAPWWGLRTDRSLATKGKFYRAGARAVELFRETAGDSVWQSAPVTIWRGGPR